jgi:cellulose synthase operon protein B
MKTRIILSIAAALSFLTPSQPSAAQTTRSAISFEQIKQPVTRLRGPSDQLFVAFATPEHWGLRAPSTIELDLDILIPGDSTSGATSSTTVTNTNSPQVAPGGRNCLAGALNVTFNGKFLDSVVLPGGGKRKVSIPIKAEALTPEPGANNRHALFIQFDASERCGVDQFAQLLVQNSSRFEFSTVEQEPVRDLTLLPRPLLQRTFDPDRAMLILPDAPSAGELEAALNVAAGFGRMTEGSLAITTTSISRMTETLWKDHHLIVVGKPAGLPIINVSALAEPLVDGKFKTTDADDGVVQLAVSPYNRERVVLVISGNSDAGVVKAGRSVSSGVVRPGIKPAVAYVASVAAPQSAVESVPDSRSFAELGYATQRSQGIGGYSFFVEFNTPNAVSLLGDGYIELSFVHSALLDYDRSNVNVYLNDVAIGSIRLSDSSTRLVRTRIPVPETVLRPGRNRMQIQSTLTSRSSERSQPFDAFWLSIQDDSSLFLRFTSKPARATRANLANLPKPFTEESNLGNVAFVLPERDPSAWAAAASMAFYIGQASSNLPLNIGAALASAVPAELREQRNLIVIGKALELPVLSEIKALPAPFKDGSNIANEDNIGVGYRVAESDDMGYLQFVQSPWNKQRSVLLAMGSTDRGVTWAGKAVTDAARRGRLTGNIAFINDAQVSAFNVRIPTQDDPAANGTAVPGAAAPGAAATSAGGVIVLTPGSISNAPVVTITAPGIDASGRSLLFILVGLIGAAIVIIVASALISQRRKRQQQQNQV